MEYVAVMHRTAFLLSFALLACGGSEPVVTETMDTRAPVAVMYVGAPEMNVREQPNDTAAIVAPVDRRAAAPG